MVYRFYIQRHQFLGIINEDKKPENTDIKAGLVYILNVNSKKPWAHFRVYRSSVLWGEKLMRHNVWKTFAIVVFLIAFFNDNNTNN